MREKPLELPGLLAPVKTFCGICILAFFKLISRVAAEGQYDANVLPFYRPEEGTWVKACLYVLRGVPAPVSAAAPRSPLTRALTT